MTSLFPSIRAGFARLSAHFAAGTRRQEFGDELPLRSELFSFAQLENHAGVLAEWHLVDPRPGPDRLLTRLADNARVLFEAHELVIEAVTRNRRISPASEWLLDNYYLIEEQIRTARRHLPRGYSRELPRLLNGPSEGYPRVYDIALELISHVDGRVDAENLGGFVSAYQKGTHLKLGELWAIPIMLRQALIENLRRVAARIGKGQVDRSQANYWADLFTDCAERDPKSLVLILADMARPDPPLSSAFVAELARRLQGQSPALTLPLTWVEQRLSESSVNIEHMVHFEAQQQAIDQVSIGNSIGSLRTLDAVNWRGFVESQSAVEIALCGDPAGSYSKMDFGTRDSYRHVIERIARQSPLTEQDVAKQAVALSRQRVKDHGLAHRSAHVGYFLIDDGLTSLESAVARRLPLLAKVDELARRTPLLLYLGSIILVMMATTSLVLWRTELSGVAGVVPICLVFVGSSQLGVALVNWLAMIRVRPHRVPRLDFSTGIPPGFETLVVVPTMLVSPGSIARLVEDLEIRFLANRDARLKFGLLTDFLDASREEMPDDERLLSIVQEGIEALNQKFRRPEGDAFYLFHRPRCWNGHEWTWMGHERKRGKLRELGKLLRGGKGDGFSRIVGDRSLLSGIRYVITLDTDTVLPHGSAHRLVGAMAHVLNHPVLDSTGSIVTKGHGILQPGLAINLETEAQSWFVRLFGGEPGVDPYTREVSDVYQDVFREGSFIGKGIYDVDAFSRTTEGRFPENRILSHDLLEGCHARSGLVTDITLYENFPPRYSIDVSRRHRWIRGDWQIARWILPTVPDTDGRSVPNPLSLLSRWKIFDNLRRSLIPSCLTLLLLVGWIALPLPWLWTAVVAGIVLTPAALRSLVGFCRKAGDMPIGLHLRDEAKELGRSMVQAALTLVFLPYEAWISLDAIVRTGVRMLVTHERMLEWKTSSDAGREDSSSLATSYRTMGAAPTTAALVLLGLAVWRPEALWAAGPMLGAWLLSPMIAWRLSQPAVRREAVLTEEQILYLHQVARKTWTFFETFVGPEDNWLPPDNYQEYPAPVVAHRTSPTNIGASLLANLAAYDFGYISAGRLIDRTRKTLETMGRLERFRGHFLNWYDTRSLQPLPPRYVSSVDSGNLAGHLVTLRRGLLELPGKRLVSSRLRSERQRREPDRSLPGLVRDLAHLRAVPAGTDGGSGHSDHLDDLIVLAPWLEQPPAPEGMWLRNSGGIDRASRSAELREEIARLVEDPTLRDVAAAESRILPVLDAVLDDLTRDEARQIADQEWLLEFREHLKSGSRRASERLVQIEQCAEQCREMSSAELEFLLDQPRQLLAIGYNVGERRRDTSHYDLLASEARLASYVGISQGQLDQDHWFALGRLLTTWSGRQMLLSWSGSMFEYLMPLLVMPNFENSLLDQTNRAVVDRQIEYGRQRGVPWGVSESGYNATDAQLNYQYRAFGVPGLGLKRGLADDLVIAPYATAMALMVAPGEACANLLRMSGLGFEGEYGFYEAIDYTPSRLAPGQTSAIIRSYMAHHQGMSFLSLAYLLLDRPMQKRFEADPLFQSTALLLQERIPRVAPFHPHPSEVSGERSPASDDEALLRVFNTPHTPAPEVHLLSNGRYHVMVTNAGGGYSLWKDLAVTRWREDSTRDNAGTFCYIRDIEDGQTWSTAFQPTLKSSSRYEAIFSQARAEFRRRDNGIQIHTEIAVSPEEDIEIRRSHLTNRSQVKRTIELTSYAEVVLASPASDATHAAFSNLFVQTEIRRAEQAILCSRRPRSHKEHPPWMLHLMAVRGASAGKTSYETDRLKFIGRGRTVASPKAMSEASSLSNSEGSVLDPIVAIRRIVTLEPDETVVVDLVTGVTDSRDASLVLIEKYQERNRADRVFDMAWTHGQVVLRQLNATESDAMLYGRLAGAVVYANGTRRADPAILARNRLGQSGLWGHGISGDLPIVLLRISSSARIDLVRQLVQAHVYWRLKGLAVDLVIWNEDQSGYRQVLHDLILGLISAGSEAPTLDRPGGIFVRRGDQMPEDARILLQTVARAIVSDSGGTLAEQLERRAVTSSRVPQLTPVHPRRSYAKQEARSSGRSLISFNGLGGFTPDGREYVIHLEPGQTTPAPWVNVIANPMFGTVVSESGGAYTWRENAHEFRLTPWYNDPVSDPSGEAFYLRDDETGHFWSPTPLPARGNEPYDCRHGFGYSVFEHRESGISTELLIYVAMDAPVKFAVLKVRNESGRSRRLSAVSYHEWVLGEMRSRSLMHTVTEVDPVCGAVIARNSYSLEFADRLAFVNVNDPGRSVTGDRTEFLGRNGSTAHPAFMSRTRLSGRVGAALDPCAALHVPFELAAGASREIVFTLGSGRDIEEVRSLNQRFRGTAAARTALEKVWEFWNRTLGAVHVETPDPGLNVMANGWLLYQTMSSRLWARSGYYQSGGAFGFRDQLQDVSALLLNEPALTREHLLRCAAHQFVEGDVQHWWHPPLDRGVRTRFSDDFLWLPLITCRYVGTTGDTGILDEMVPFLEGRAVRPDEESYYDLPARSGETGTLYEHCVRAITRGLTFGVHGLPLIGCGDWNDGMNLVGEEGKGESVWLAFFLHENLRRFSELARARGDIAFADRCDTEAARLHENIEKNAWDGEWYRRAYFDNGEPLGSSTSAECQIDSIPQSWSVLSRAGTPERNRQAMDAVDRRLVRREDSIIQLFDPPFDRSTLDPGYIKGYVPGVRENGGQYTHAAIWTVMAFAEMGDARRSWDLFSMINPVNLGDTPQKIARYKVEPYVIAADVYGVAPHIGRGGWTWYTGSAGWMYRLIVESILGLRLEVDRLHFTPCLPPEWTSFKLHYRYRSTFFHITVKSSKNGRVVTQVMLDGAIQPGGFIPLVDDRENHQVRVELD